MDANTCFYYLAYGVCILLTRAWPCPNGFWISWIFCFFFNAYAGLFPEYCSLRAVRGPGITRCLMPCLSRRCHGPSWKAGRPHLLGYKYMARKHHENGSYAHFLRTFMKCVIILVFFGGNHVLVINKYFNRCKLILDLNCSLPTFLHV